MKIGDVVRLKPGVDAGFGSGIVIGFELGYTVVFWNLDFPAAMEYPEQLEVICKLNN